MRATPFWILPILALFINESTCKAKEKVGEQHVVFQFDRMDFEGNLPTGTDYIPDRNIISGIEVYNGDVYVNIPRHGQTTGIPATLAKITKNSDGKVLFSPFPNWDFQKPGICKNLQDVRSVEVDPRTNLMYIADNGNGQACGAKVVVYDLVKKVVNATYPLKNKQEKWVDALSDIVVDNHGVVYIANSNKYGSLWIIDTKEGQTYCVQHHSFRGVDFKPFVFENDTYTKNTSINMLALTPDSKFIFYSANDNALWQFGSNMKKQLISFQRGEIDGARKVGQKKYQGFDIEMGDRFLFLSNVADKSISYWDRVADLAKQRVDESVLVKESEVALDIQPKLKYFPGKISLDKDGYLWVVTMDLPKYFNDTEDADRGVEIVKIFVDNKPYNNPKEPVSGSGRIFLSAVIVIVCGLLAAM